MNSLKLQMTLSRVLGVSGCSTFAGHFASFSVSVTVHVGSQ